MMRPLSTTHPGLAAATCILALGACLLGSACESPTGLQVDLESYDPLPPIPSLDFATVDPAKSWIYWELRFGFGPSAQDSIVGSHGTVTRDELPATVRNELDELELPTGFAGGCLPAWCFKYVAAVDPEGEVATFATTAALIEFLGPRDSLAEAVLLLDAAGYYWETASNNWLPEGQRATGIRPDQDGWEAVVLELTRACAPVQTDQVLVRVGRTGDLSVLRRGIFSRLEDACV